MILAFFLNQKLVISDFKKCNLETKQNCPKAEVVVVISGGDTRARTLYGVKIFKSNIAQYAMIVAGAASQKGVPSNAEEMKEIAIENGIESDKIIIEPKSNTTHENAKNVAKILKENKINSIILVTSGYHQKRAFKEFSNYMSKETKIFNAPVIKDKDWSPTWWLSTRGWELAIKEFGANILVARND